MKYAAVGILAHVDAGKTTLAEALLYRCGKLKKPGRVDHGDTAMDSHVLERERGITIFTGQARLPLGELELTLLDTPGHVDFSAETERTLQVLDYAILVISGTDGVQAHTKTLWKLLEFYRVPACIFVTKTDLLFPGRAEMLAELRRELSPACTDFSEDAAAERDEQIAVCREQWLDAYLAGEPLPENAAAEAVRGREVFPVLFGSGLKLEGIDELLELLRRTVTVPDYPESFGARVFKITHDGQGARLTHIKITGGTLRPRDEVTYGAATEKVTQLRIYNGARFAPAEAVSAGGICTVLGLSAAKIGEALGTGAAAPPPVLEPVMNYRLELPEDCDIRVFLPKLRTLEEEDPRLHVHWDTRLHELRVGLMGDIQAEILKSVILERFGVAVEIGEGSVVYRETIAAPVEGVGHYEPLRHYAEVHLLLEPLPRGSGVQVATRCSEDVLDRNWQRLIITHLLEKQHLGVLTGSPVTDIKIILAAGRAHLKHTEGGDFRQATYRAVRQGLMQAESVLLEPLYRFRLEVPAAQVGRAITDVRSMHGTFDAPETSGAVSILTGTAPVCTMNGYARVLASWSHGTGRLMLEPGGYGVCHNPEQVISKSGYVPESDLENTPDSVFCAHGAGFPVRWDKVPEYMHLESCLRPAAEEPLAAPAVVRRNLSLDDKELEQIMLREFGPVKRPVYKMPAAVSSELPERKLPERPERPSLLLADGYNLIFCWDELREQAKTDLAGARTRLLQRLCNYAAYTKTQTVVVFDAYRVKDNPETREPYHNLQVIYTKEGETCDMYIEKITSKIGKNERVRVVTSDSMIQLSAFRSGVLRTGASEFEREVAAAEAEIGGHLKVLQRQHLGTVGEQPGAEEVLKNGI